MKDFAKSLATLKASLKPIFQTFDLGKDSVAQVALILLKMVVKFQVKFSNDIKRAR